MGAQPALTLRERGKQGGRMARGGGARLLSQCGAQHGDGRLLQPTLARQLRQGQQLRLHALQQRSQHLLRARLQLHPQLPRPRRPGGGPRQRPLPRALPPRLHDAAQEQQVDRKVRLLEQQRHKGVEQRSVGVVQAAGLHVVQRAEHQRGKRAQGRHLLGGRGGQRRGGTGRGAGHGTGAAHAHGAHRAAAAPQAQGAARHEAEGRLAPRAAPGVETCLRRRLRVGCPHRRLHHGRACAHLLAHQRVRRAHVLAAKLRQRRRLQRLHDLHERHKRAHGAVQLRVAQDAALEGGLHLGRAKRILYALEAAHQEGGGAAHKLVRVGRELRLALADGAHAQQPLAQAALAAGLQLPQRALQLPRAVHHLGQPPLRQLPKVSGDEQLILGIIRQREVAQDVAQGVQQRGAVLRRDLQPIVAQLDGGDVVPQVLQPEIVHAHLRLHVLQQVQRHAQPLQHALHHCVALQDAVHVGSLQRLELVVQPLHKLLHIADAHLERLHQPLQVAFLLGRNRRLAVAARVVALRGPLRRQALLLRRQQLRPELTQQRQRLLGAGQRGEVGHIHAEHRWRAAVVLRGQLVEACQQQAAVVLRGHAVRDAPLRQAGPHGGGERERQHRLAVVPLARAAQRLHARQELQGHALADL
mmetsp:Transcript_36294/g.94250  ORF Transcript_36294/g.94250 Transcript_36294/m.94250 type:complete len:641 (+) Transcript_36294:1092-3014(+)